ncbi:hypothetical protein SAMD00023353_0503200 [Rosellinia necatrix]|uniref:Uncharacterized protein n=1 Tax=Rosellinia necatrix TaxID=77044 RepID=A0A1S7ULH2_ROSNE|nr:hypothetical protein SAMD00023353_0503200 [Rosellinia necatrix]
MSSLQTFHAFDRLSFEIQAEIWEMYFHNHYHYCRVTERVHVLDAVSGCAQEHEVQSTVMDGNVLFRSTVVDIAAGKVLPNFPYPSLACYCAYTVHQRLLRKSPEIVPLSFQNAVNFTLNVNYQLGLTEKERQDTSMISLAKTTIPTERAAVNWNLDMVYLSGLSSELAFWAMMLSGWGRRVHHLAVDVKAHSANTPDVRYNILAPYRANREPPFYFGFAIPRRFRNLRITDLSELSLWQRMYGSMPLRSLCWVYSCPSLDPAGYPRDRYGFTNYAQYLRLRECTTLDEDDAQFRVNPSMIENFICQINPNIPTRMAARIE